ncbi:MAG: ASKHA domain-containing protein [Dehalococcoidales bacterium]|nr:ASKHA domain-containing protein [Dehalococcoidales bacterium]
MTENSSCSIRTVHFEPDNIDIIVQNGANLMEAAVAAGVHINASCGGAGVCGTCNVIINNGMVESVRTDKISEKDYEKGVRQACKSNILSDLNVEIPAASRLEKAILSREEMLSTSTIAVGWKYDPPVKKIYIELSPPTPQDNSSDLSRLLKELTRQMCIESISIEPNTMKKLADTLRAGNWKVTVTTLLDLNSGIRLIKIEPGDTRARHYSLAFDIGTTAVRGQLLDLNRAKVLSQNIDYNRQISYGEDVISRISQSQKTGGLERLQKAIVSTLNDLIKKLVDEAGINTNDICHMVVAANTVMVQLLLSLNPKYLRLSPYVPTANVFPPVVARSLGIEISDHVQLNTIPCVASYVGGDIVSGILGTGIFQREALTLYIDIGTNGEIVLGNKDWMISAACSAGPTFEGGGIKYGMIATSGAIEGFDIDPENYEPIITTVDNAKPKGICGSGLINTAAILLKNGVIDQKGKYNNLPSRRIRKGYNGYEYILAYAAETQIDKDIVLSEIDIDNLIRSKAAMYAGYYTLIQSTGKSFSDIQQVVIAGTFGSKINIENAIIIGLLPDLPRNKFIFIGNGSLLGARLTSFSSELLYQGQIVAGMMTNLELSENKEFMDNYLAALFLPHTNADEFPSIKTGGI